MAGAPFQISTAAPVDEIWPRFRQASRQSHTFVTVYKVANGQGRPGAAKSSREQPRVAGGSREQPGAARGSQEQPGAAKGSQQQQGAARKSKHVRSVRERGATQSETAGERPRASESPPAKLNLNMRGQGRKPSEPTGGRPRASEGPPPCKTKPKYVRAVCTTKNHEAEARGTTLGITKP